MCIGIFPLPVIRIIKTGCKKSKGKFPLMLISQEKYRKNPSTSSSFFFFCFLHVNPRQSISCDPNALNFCIPLFFIPLFYIPFLFLYFSYPIIRTSPYYRIFLTHLRVFWCNHSTTRRFVTAFTVSHLFSPFLVCHVDEELHKPHTLQCKYR